MILLRIERSFSICLVLYGALIYSVRSVFYFWGEWMHKIPEPKGVWFDLGQYITIK